MEKARKRTNSFSYCLSRSDSCKSLVLEKDKDSDRESLIQRKKEAKEYYSKISKPVKTKSKKVSKKTKEEHPRDTASREVQTNIKILKGFGDLIDLDEEYQRLTTEFESKLLVKQAEIDKLKANLEEQKINNKSIITLFKIETQKIDLITQKISNFVESQKSEEFENLPSNEKIKSLFLADCEELSLSDNSGDFSAKDKSSPDALSNEFDERCTNLHNKVNELINISKRNTSENLFIEQNLSDNKASSDHSSNICNYCEQEKKLSIDESPETCKNKQVVQLNPNPEEVSNTNNNEEQTPTKGNKIVAWKDEKDVKSCKICKLNFNWLNHKHHCRVCGNIFCNQCSSYFVLISGIKQRACKFCRDDHDEDNLNTIS